MQVAVQQQGMARCSSRPPGLICTATASGHHIDSIKHLVAQGRSVLVIGCAFCSAVAGRLIISCGWSERAVVKHCDRACLCCCRYVYANPSNPLGFKQTTKRNGKDIGFRTNEWWVLLRLPSMHAAFRLSPAQASSSRLQVFHWKQWHC